MKTQPILLISICITLLFITACSGNTDSLSATKTQSTGIAQPSVEEKETPATPTSTTPQSATTPKPTISSFHYQLQSASYNNLKSLDVDLIVIDIDDAAFTEKDLNDLKQAKKVLSYLSIGEAEDYRDYWQESWKPGSPDFIDKENPDWKGNYKVKYWLPEWQEIIIKRIETIATSGYDGIYLDIIDAYQYYEEQGRTSAANEMVDFVIKIRKKGKSINPDFLIVPQNSPELYAFNDYRQAIDGFGKEDTWYNDDDTQDAEDRNAALKHLDSAISDKKFVLAIDYPTENKNICDFYTNCSSHNFACLVSNRDLNLKSPIFCEK